MLTLANKIRKLNLHNLILVGFKFQKSILGLNTQIKISKNNALSALTFTA